MATSNTDYVSLRRLVEYHNVVVKRAIEAGGTVRGVKFEGGSNLTIDDDKIVIIPHASTSSEGVLTVAAFNTFNNKVGSIKLGNNIALTPTNGLVTIPAASQNTDGYLTREDWKKIDAVYSVLGDPNTDDTGDALDKLYEVFTFLDDYKENTDLATLMNNKASLDGMNTFTNTNSFNGGVTFNSGAFFMGAQKEYRFGSGTVVSFYDGARFGDMSDYLKLGRADTDDGRIYSMSKPDGTKLLIPISSVSQGASDYLTIVKVFGNTNSESADTSIPVLKECEAITEALFN